MRSPLLLAAMTVLVASSLLAQGTMRGSGGAAPGFAHQGFSPHHGFIPPNRIRSGISGTPFGHGFHRHGFHHTVLYPWPYTYPDYADYEEAYEPPLAAPLQFAPTPAAEYKPEPVPDPMLLEWRDGQWVKVTFATGSQAAAMPLQPRPVTKEIPPTILVYRDGHMEELTSYSIIGTSIYTKSDYWTNGAWRRTIQIADLDIPATLKQNQDRGVKFELPSGPNEVIIRP